MTQAYLIYPHQLYEVVLAQTLIRTIVIVEEPLLFKQFLFHKKKLIFHRSTMKAFSEALKEKGLKVVYVDSNQIENTEDIVLILKKHNISKVHMFDLVDEWLEKRLFSACKESNIEIGQIASPGFYLAKKDVEQDFENHSKFAMASFYAKQRKRFDILIEDGKPEGGKWSFDTENRKKLPKNCVLPRPQKDNDNLFVKDATIYVQKHFFDNYGSTENFFYPITHDAARIWLNEFLENRFSSFGPYQDAICKNDSLLFHSILSPLLNVGLITPDEVIIKAITFAHQQSIPINCLEGFIRQILGWREFVRLVYCKIGGKQRTKNFWGHTRVLPKSFWNGTTGIDPVDNIIHKVCKTGYANHIERLMIMSNFMLLCEICPDDVYRWFMELFIDAYDWVMVPNVYGMGLYSDGGMITTKPYISSSNYILKMSDFTKGSWCDIWNSLYWNFIYNNKEVFEQNHRSQPLLFQLNKMDVATLIKHREDAAIFLNKI